MTRLKNKVFLAALLGCLLLNNFAFASKFKDDVKSAFHEMNSMSNSTRRGTHETQTAMYHTGGSYMERYPIRDYQIFSLQGPSWDAGCGGIDLFGGGFSHINSDEIKQMLANIASNSKGLVYKLGIDIVSAQLGGAIGYMQDVADKFKGLAINSCEAAHTLVGGAVGVATGGDISCVANRMKKGLSENYPDAVKACRKGSNPDSTNPDKMDEGAKEQAPLLGNLTWRSMARANLFNSNNKTNHDDQSLRYAVMAMVGTVVKTTDSPAWTEHIAMYPGGSIIQPKAGLSNEELGKAINSLMYGGKLTTLNCKKVPASGKFDDDFACVDLEWKTDAKIDANDAFYKQMDDVLKGLITGIATETPASEQELNFLSTTNLPVWSFLASAYAAGGANLANNYREYLAEILAREYMHNYLEGIIGEVQKSIIEYGGGNDDSKRYLLSDINRTIIKLRELKEKHEKSQDHVYKLIAQQDTYKKIIMSRIPAGTFAPGNLLNNGY